MGSFILNFLLVTFPMQISGPILYQVHQGHINKAFSSYLEYSAETGEDDFELLQQTGLRLLEQGASSGDPEIEVLSLFGAGVAISPELIPILEKGIQSAEMRSQLVALHFLAGLQDDEADRVIANALSSPFLLTRLEAALVLANKQDPSVIGHLQSLYHKVPPAVRPLFAQIAAPLESEIATLFLKQLLADTDVLVRIEAVFQIAKAQRDELLPYIRSLARHPDCALQETCVWALGKLKDRSSLPLLWELSRAKQDSLRLAALDALYQLGEREAIIRVKEMALEKNAYAVALLGDWKEESDLLYSLMHDNNPDIRLNAGLGLLLHNDDRCFPLLEEIFLTSQKDVGFRQQRSAGQALSSWHWVSSLSVKQKKEPKLVHDTLRLREKVLRMAVELPEGSFYKTAYLLFEKKLIELVPLLVELLRNHNTPQSIDLLKMQQQRTGAPFIRNYCNLALFKLHEEGPYEENLLSFVKSEQQNALIQFNEEEKNTSSLIFTLNPEQKSKLLVESFEALAAAQNKAGIRALLQAMAYGNPKNKYALAGLLIRTAE